MRRVLIVGQGPGRCHQRGCRALDGPEWGSGDRLAQLAGMSKQQLLERCDTVNLLQRYYGRSRNGDIFPKAIAEKRARELYKDFFRYDWVILLGMKVARAFKMNSGSQIFTVGGTGIALLPHPSGLNRFYNDPKNVKQAREFFRAVLG